MKEGVKAVSDGIQVLAAEMREIIRSMAEREFKRVRRCCRVA